MYKTALKSIVILTFLFVCINLNENQDFSNEEHPGMNSIKNSINIANEEHPGMNSIKILG